MTQKVLPINGAKRYSRRVLSGATGVVALDRSESNEIILRFLDTTTAWSEPAREVKLDYELAEQLQKLLAEELEDAMPRVVF